MEDDSSQEENSSDATTPTGGCNDNDVKLKQEHDENFSHCR